MATSVLDVTETGAKPTHTLQCMEIWGGNGPIESGVSVPGIDAWIHSFPHGGDKAGGDIYYVSTCGHGIVSRFTVADVAGHGMAVDDLASELREMVRRYINTADQTQFARELNHALAENADAHRFATALLTTYISASDHLVTVNAGHPPPLWYRASHEQWQVLNPDLSCCSELVANLPLGVIDRTEYEQFAVELGKGDLVVIYTDSLIEATDRKGEPLTVDGLLEVVSHLDVSQPGGLSRELIDTVQAYRGGRAAEDDVTVMVLHHNATDPPEYGWGNTARNLAKMVGLVKV